MRNADGLSVFFYVKIKKTQGATIMLCDLIRERYYSDVRIKDSIPIIFSSQCLFVIDDILEDFKKENEYASISELFNE